MPQLDSLLEEFASIADDRFDEYPPEKRYRYFQDFFQQENLRQAEWEDFQEMSHQIHALSNPPVARAMAFGDPNHPIERYRESFEFLVRGDAPLADRLTQISGNDDPYGIHGVADNTVGELAGYLFAQDYLIRNRRSRGAIEDLGFDLPNQDLSFGERFIQFSEVAEPVVDAYEEIVGSRTEAPIHLEVDQFLSWIYQADHVGGDDQPSQDAPASGDPDGEMDRRYFWLNCDPDRWDPRQADLEDTQSFTARTEAGNLRRRSESFRGARPGDRAVAYVTSPAQQVACVFEVTEGIDTEGVDSGGDGQAQIEVKKVEDLPEGPSREALTSDPELHLQPLGARGTLFPLEKAQYEALVNYGPGDYTIGEATEDLFYGPKAVRAWVDRLQTRKNLILQGPPGVGKSFVSQRLAYLLLGQKVRGRVQTVQLHQSYSYEDFIRGYRPDPDGGFRLKDGVFFRFCERAKDDLENDYVFIIDEINRGNLSKVFGELMRLIEPEKRGPADAMPLAYQRDGNDPYGNRFYVPENVHLIGTMNTADRSLAMVDYALRRRFAFVDMEPRFESDAFHELLRGRGADEDLIERIRVRLQSLNEEIASDSNLGTGFRIGHSYFCPAKSETPDEDWYRAVVDREIAPLLEEYWFDDPDTAAAHIDDLKA